MENSVFKIGNCRLHIMTKIVLYYLWNKLGVYADAHVWKANSPKRIDFSRRKLNVPVALIDFVHDVAMATRETRLNAISFQYTYRVAVVDSDLESVCPERLRQALKNRYVVAIMNCKNAGVRRVNPKKIAGGLLHP